MGKVSYLHTRTRDTCFFCSIILMLVVGRPVMAQPDEALKTYHSSALDTSVILWICGFMIVCLTAGLVIMTRRIQVLKRMNEKLVTEKDEQLFIARRELARREEKNKALHEDVLQQSLETRVHELPARTIDIIRKNQLLRSVHDALERMLKEDNKDQRKELQQLIRQIDINFDQHQHWDEFTAIFEQVHESFFEKVKRISGELNSNDLKLVALLKMNVSTSDMSALLGITPDSLRVTRYRLRKKFNLPKGEDLSSFIHRVV